jgi:aryl-alcohol dehydrogenase-like predicted oxidoreductase
LSDEQNLNRNLQLVDRVEAPAGKHGIAAGQLAWVLAQGDHITAIPGTERRRAGAAA